ncbi:putative secreted protein [Ramicandelaber brevisporus]|nr:putative secreted protein [Ramicandelaber brevisporus]
MAEQKPVTVLALAFDKLEILDLFGPLELFSLVPGCSIKLVSIDGKPIRTKAAIETVVDYSFDNAPTNPDIFLVPGGLGTRTIVHESVYTDFIKRIGDGAGVVLSVCTGAALLAQAGLLDGRRATTNKRSFAFPMKFGKDIDWVYRARWVEDGKFVTSSGVSAGIDAAAQVIEKVWGPEIARQSVNAAEYDWHTDSNWDIFGQHYQDPTVPVASDN